MNESEDESWEMSMARQFMTTRILRSTTLSLGLRERKKSPLKEKPEKQKKKVERKKKKQVVAPKLTEKKGEVNNPPIDVSGKNKISRSNVSSPRGSKKSQDESNKAKEKEDNGDDIDESDLSKNKCQEEDHDLDFESSDEEEPRSGFQAIVRKYNERNRTGLLRDPLGYNKGGWENIFQGHPMLLNPEGESSSHLMYPDFPHLPIRRPGDEEEEEEEELEEVKKDTYLPYWAGADDVFGLLTNNKKYTLNHIGFFDNRPRFSIEPNYLNTVNQVTSVHPNDFRNDPFFYMPEKVTLDLDSCSQKTEKLLDPCQGKYNVVGSSGPVKRLRNEIMYSALDRHGMNAALKRPRFGAQQNRDGYFQMGSGQSNEIDHSPLDWSVSGRKDFLRRHNQLADNLFWDFVSRNTFSTELVRNKLRNRVVCPFLQPRRNGRARAVANIKDYHDHCGPNHVHAFEDTGKKPDVTKISEPDKPKLKSKKPSLRTLRDLLKEQERKLEVSSAAESKAFKRNAQDKNKNIRKDSKEEKKTNSPSNSNSSGIVPSNQSLDEAKGSFSQISSVEETSLDKSTDDDDECSTAAAADDDKNDDDDDVVLISMSDIKNEVNIQFKDGYQEIEIPVEKLNDMQVEVEVVYEKSPVQIPLIPLSEIKKEPEEDVDYENVPPDEAYQPTSLFPQLEFQPEILENLKREPEVETETPPISEDVEDNTDNNNNKDDASGNELLIPLSKIKQEVIELDMKTVEEIDELLPLCSPQDLEAEEKEGKTVAAEEAMDGESEAKSEIPLVEIELLKEVEQELLEEEKRTKKKGILSSSSSSSSSSEDNEKKNYCCNSSSEIVGERTEIEVVWDSSTTSTTCSAMEFGRGVQMELRSGSQFQFIIDLDSIKKEVGE